MGVSWAPGGPEILPPQGLGLVIYPKLVTPTVAGGTDLGVIVPAKSGQTFVTLGVSFVVATFSGSASGGPFTVDIGSNSPSFTDIASGLSIMNAGTFDQGARARTSQIFASTPGVLAPGSAADIHALMVTPIATTGATTGWLCLFGFWMEA